MDTAQIHKLTFRTSIVLLAIGALMGLAGVWVDEFWSHEWAWKLIVTDGILFAATTAGAIITKLLA